MNTDKLKRKVATVQPAGLPRLASSGYGRAWFGSLQPRTPDDHRKEAEDRESLEPIAIRQEREIPPE